MTARRYRDNSIMALTMLFIFTLTTIKSCTVNAQPSRSVKDDLILKRVKAWDDSVRRVKARNKPLYIGGELALAFPQYSLRSKIDALNGLNVNYIGTNLGGVIGNSFGKLKANVGLYYSEPSVPYTMEMLQGAVAGTIYVLRLKHEKSHSLEPYITLGLARQLTKFYGNYLPADTGSPASNYSVTDQPLLGRTGFTQMNTGVGVEYQLTSCNFTFIHLFAEASYGVVISSNASNQAFSKTRITNPTAFSLGINFGIRK